MIRSHRSHIWNAAFACSLLAPATLHCQTVPPARQLPSAVELPSFEVASVKINNSGSNSFRSSVRDGNLLVQNAPLIALIRQAYSLYNSNDDLITGLPAWAKNERFDIQAKVSEEDGARIKGLTREQRGQMLLALLEDRFKLKARVEQREIPIYALIVAKGGAKVAESRPGESYAHGLLGPDGTPRGAGSTDYSRGHFRAQAAPLDSLASILTQQLDRPVLNRTGLTGNYDYTLDWTPDLPSGPDGAADPPPPANAPPTLFTAIQEQLGLRLEASRGVVPAVVIEHIEEPSAN